MVLMYLHGFRSSPDSNKGQVMREALGEKFTFLAPDLNVSPLAVQKILLETVKDINPSQLCLAGSSLGGFYATWLAEKIGCRAILFNPATEPWCVINDYLGVQPIANTGRTIEVNRNLPIKQKVCIVKLFTPSVIWSFCQRQMKCWTGIRRRKNTVPAGKFFCLKTRTK